MIDLHTHTNNSDGEFSTEQLLNIAEENKLKYFSITDVI
jgi:predicted metal-dependent phosphoesterase TrpH